MSVETTIGLDENDLMTPEYDTGVEYARDNDIQEHKDLLIDLSALDKEQLDKEIAEIRDKAHEKVNEERERLEETLGENVQHNSKESRYYEITVKNDGSYEMFDLTENRSIEVSEDYQSFMKDMTQKFSNGETIVSIDTDNNNASASIPLYSRINEAGETVISYNSVFFEGESSKGVGTIQKEYSGEEFEPEEEPSGIEAEDTFNILDQKKQTAQIEISNDGLENSQSVNMDVQSAEQPSLSEVLEVSGETLVADDAQEVGQSITHDHVAEMTTSYREDLESSFVEVDSREETFVSETNYEGLATSMLSLELGRNNRVDDLDILRDIVEGNVIDKKNAGVDHTVDFPTQNIGHSEQAINNAQEAFIHDIAVEKTSSMAETTLGAAHEVSEVSVNDLQLFSSRTERNTSSIEENPIASESPFVETSNSNQEIKKSVNISDTEAESPFAEVSSEKQPESNDMNTEIVSDTAATHEKAPSGKNSTSVSETSVDAANTEIPVVENDVHNIDTETNFDNVYEVRDEISETVVLVAPERGQEQVLEKNPSDMSETVVTETHLKQDNVKEAVLDQSERIREKVEVKDQEVNYEPTESVRTEEILTFNNNENIAAPDVQIPEAKSPELLRQALENSSVREQTTTSSNNEKETTWQDIETNMREVVSSPAVEAQNILWGEQSIKELVSPKIASEIDKAQTALEKDEPGTVRVVRSGNNVETEVLVLGKNEDNTVSVGFYEPKVGPHGDSGMASVETSPFVDNSITIASSPRKQSVTGRESLVLQIPDEELDIFVTLNSRLGSADDERSSEIFKTDQETRSSYIPSPESPGLGGTRGGQLFFDTDTDTDNEPTRNLSSEHETDSLLMKT